MHIIHHTLTDCLKYVSIICCSTLRNTFDSLSLDRQQPINIHTLIVALLLSTLNVTGSNNVCCPRCAFFPLSNWSLLDQELISNKEKWLLNPERTESHRCDQDNGINISLSSPSFWLHYVTECWHDDAATSNESHETKKNPSDSGALKYYKWAQTQGNAANMRGC